MKHKVLVASALTAATLAAGLAWASAAAAHVTVSAPGATQGGYTTLTFKVPTEGDTASTVGLKVQLPTDHPIESVAVQPKPGWTYKLTRGASATPASVGDDQRTEGITQIEWTATGPGIKPGEFDSFVLSAGPLPTTTDTLTFKAVQRYSDGKDVAWIDVPAAGGTSELEHPAPTLRVASAVIAASGAGPQPASGGTETSGWVLGALGVLLGVTALTVALRRRPSTSRPDA